MKRRQSYTAVFDRDPRTGAWNVEIAEEPRVHTWGRTLAVARRHIREALVVWLDTDETAFELVEDVRLPEKTRRAVEKIGRAKAGVDRAQTAAQQAVVTAARSLLDAGLSLRDAGDLLGLSHQRVSQIVSASR